MAVAMETMETKRFGSFLDRLKAKLDKDMDPDELRKMAWLMKDKLQHEFIPLSNCELPSNVVDYLDQNMMRREVITVLKHVLKCMEYHSDVGTFSFYKFIEEYEAECTSVDEDNLVGRENDIEAIFDLFENTGCQGVWIHGLGGMGKTTLAKTIGLRYKINMSWNVITVDLKKVNSMVDMYRAILGHFSSSSKNSDEGSLKAETLNNIHRLKQSQTSKTIHALPKAETLNHIHRLKHSQQNTCFLLDNFEDVYDVDKEGANTFLATMMTEKGSNVKILVTSRTKLAPSLASGSRDSEAVLTEYELQKLDDASAYKLLRLCCKPKVLREDQCAQVLTYCGGIPLALRLVVNSIRSLKDDTILDREIHSLSRSQTHMQECIEYAFEKLNSTLKNIATLLAVFDTSTFEASDAAEVLDMPEQETTLVLMYLCHCHVLNELEDNTAASLIDEAHAATIPDLAYNFHPLVANWLRRKQTETPTVLRDCQIRFCKRMFKKMRLACQDYFRDGPRCIRYIHNNSAMLKSLFILTQAGTFDKDIALDDCVNINTVSSFILTDSEKQELFTNSIDSFRGIPQHCEIFWRVQIAADNVDSGRLDVAESMFTAIQAELTDHDESNARVSAELYRHYARLLRRKRNFVDAKQYLERALTLLRKCETEEDQIISVIADVLNSFGNVYFDMKDFDKSMEYHKMAIDQMGRIRMREEGMVPLEMSVYIFNIGAVAFSKANQILNHKDPECRAKASHFYKECLERYEESLQIDRSLNVDELPKYAEKLQIRAKARTQVKDFDGALNDTKEALRIICKTYTGVHSKITIAKYRVGKVYLDWYLDMKKKNTNSVEDRGQKLAMAQENFNSAVQDIYKGGLTMDDRESLEFLDELQCMATQTMQAKYIDEVKIFCLKFKHKRRFDADDDSDETDSSVEDPETPEHSPENVELEEMHGSEPGELAGAIEYVDMEVEDSISDFSTPARKRKKDSDSE